MASLFYLYRFANVEYDESEGTLRVSGREVTIEPRPLHLLSELLRRPNEVISKDELLDIVWEGRPTVDNVLASAVSKLRMALGEEGAKRLVTLPRVGYRLDGPIDRMVVGQHTAAALTMKAGEPVPGREAYQLDRALGKAGGGEVWLARDSKRNEIRVFKFASDSERLTALKREYTLYRVLYKELGERRDFAHVVSANFASAPYFLECEYGGPDLLAWAAEGDRLKAMQTAERVALFLQIARAVATAHAVGVLHKDLNPANVLIAADGDGWIAKLTDFGSSRLLEPGRLAQLGVTAMGLTMTQGVGTDPLGGTPMYLAPELLAEQPPTTQSDLYALGLMFYQMLVGDFRRPMATGWQRHISDELLREDLIAATEGRPEDRLSSVAELVERLSTLDIRRAAAIKTAEESRRAAETARDLEKRRSRRPWVMAAFATLAIGLAASLWFYRQATAALLQAQQASTQATQISDFLHRDVLEATDSITAGTEVKPKSMLDVLRRASKTASDRFAGQPIAEATLRRRFGETYMKMASLVDSYAELTKSIALLTPIVPATDPDLLMAHFLRARLLSWMERPEAARQELEEAERNAGATALSATTELGFVATRARCEYLQNIKKYTEALPVAQQLVKVSDTLRNVGILARIDARQRLAEAYAGLGDTEKTEAVLAELRGPPFYAQSATNAFHNRQYLLQGQQYNAEGNYSEAVKALLAGRDWAFRGEQPNPMHSSFIDLELGLVYEAQGELEKATASLNAALDAFNKAVGAEHQYRLTTQLELAHLYLMRDKPTEALQLYDTFEDWQQRTFGKRPWFPLVDYGRAVALIDLHKPAEALPLLESLKVADIRRVSIWTDWQQRFDFNRGRALIGMGRREEGLTLMRKAIAEMESNQSWPWLVARYRQQIASASTRELSAQPKLISADHFAR